MNEQVSADFRCGYAAIVGRPNVGKSTLLNALIGQKLSITSPKPQTTRHRILGIKTLADAQILYVDTPGLHLHGKRAMNRYLNRAASGAIGDVDVVIFVVEGTRWTEEDQLVLDKVRAAALPAILVVNKVDLLPDKGALLPHLQFLAQQFEFVAVVPMSARARDNIAALEREVAQRLPAGAPFFAQDQLTDRSERFLAAEIIREKLMRNLEQELPYALTVQIEKFAEEGELLRIAGLILVERSGQKSIVIGKGGAQLKLVGQQARQDMEKLFGRKVFLQLWVKVKEGWSDDERALRSLGYTDSGDV